MGSSCKPRVPPDRSYNPCQHYPLYRKSDANCSGEDAAPPEEKSIPFKEKYDVLSQEASQKVCPCCDHLSGGPAPVLSASRAAWVGMVVPCTCTIDGRFFIFISLRDSFHMLCPSPVPAVAASLAKTKLGTRHLIPVSHLAGWGDPNHYSHDSAPLGLRSCSWAGAGS